MTNIVINYRREDVPAEARRIRDALAARLGPATPVTLTDDAAASRGQLGAGDTLVTLIGPRWLDVMRAHASRGERDDVRSEIAAALRRGLTILPVRVGRADAMPAMPRPDELPEDIRALGQLRSNTVAVERLDLDTTGLVEAFRPSAGVVTRERAPGNSMFKMWIWAGAVMAATVAFANALYYFTVASTRPTFPQSAAQSRPSLNLPAWTGEGRIRRAIEAALAKGRRPEEARRCQTSLITATDAGTIQFDTGSAEIDSRSFATLDALARIIKDCPDFIVEVEGHTDNVGEPGNNQRLSERRANSVRDYLVRSGVTTVAITAAGYGETRPIAPNDTPANMARNRRIEFNISAR